MSRLIPEKLQNFLKNAIDDVEDGYEYASELRRILNSDDCQRSLTARELDLLYEYAEKVKSVGEITYYTKNRIKDIETDLFGSRGISGFLGIAPEQSKPVWPF